MTEKERELLCVTSEMVSLLLHELVASRLEGHQDVSERAHALVSRAAKLRELLGSSAFTSAPTLQEGLLQARVLAALVALRYGTFAPVAREAGISEHEASQHLRDLERRGLVARLQDSEDPQGIVWAVTSEGAARAQPSEKEPPKPKRRLHMKPGEVEVLRAVRDCPGTTRALSARVERPVIEVLERLAQRHAVPKRRGRWMITKEGRAALEGEA